MTKNQMSLDNIVFIALITLAASILMSAIQLPFILKYGAEKGRLIMVITYFLIFALSTLLKEKSNFLAELMEIFSKNSISMICLGILVVSILIIGLAVKLSVMIMEKKEY